MSEGKRWDVVHRAAKRKAKQLLFQGRIRADELADVEQHLLLAGLTALDKYDPARGAPTTFARSVVCNASRKLLAYRRAGKRDSRRIALSMDTTTYGESGLSALTRPGDLQEGSSVDPSRGSTLTEGDERDLILDTRRVICALPRHHQMLVGELTTHPVTAIARLRGVHRSTIHALRTKLRPYFRSIHQDYLRPEPVRADDVARCGL